MILHAETLNSTGIQQARFNRLAFFLPQTVGFDFVDSYRREAVGAAELIRKDSRISDMLNKVIDESLDQIGKTIKESDRDLAISIAPQAVEFSKAQSLITDYNVGNTEEPTIIVPANKITAVKTLPFRQSATSPNPIIDLRVQTSADEPIATYTYESGRREVVELPNPGKWHRFPLDMISLGLVS